MAERILNHTEITADGAEPERWLLVLHGIYGTGRNWGTIARRVVEQRREWGVLLVDLRLHGGSQGFAPPHTLQATAADVDDLVEALDFHAAAVLGHSFGGKVALLYGRHHAEDLRQIWIIDSTLQVREPSGTAWRMIEVVRSLPESFESRQEAVEGLTAAGYDPGVAQWMAMNLEPSDGRYQWRLDFDGVEEMLRDYFRTDVWEVIADPPERAELHVVAATRSDAIDPESAERIRAAGERTGRVFLHKVEGGHWLNAENPNALIELLTGTLP